MTCFISKYLNIAVAAQDVYVCTRANAVLSRIVPWALVVRPLGRLLATTEDIVGIRVE